MFRQRTLTSTPVGRLNQCVRSSLKPAVRADPMLAEPWAGKLGAEELGRSLLSSAGIMLPKDWF
jgi:hypothetical protein